MSLLLSHVGFRLCLRPLGPGSPSQPSHHKWAFILCIASALVWSGCVSNTMITSSPTGAHVTMDKTKRIGQTPILLQEQAWVWTKHELRFSHEGYRAEVIEVSARARPEMLFLSCFGVVTCCYWPLALLGKTPGKLHIKLTPDYSVDPFDGVKRTSLDDHPRINFE